MNVTPVLNLADQMSKENYELADRLSATKLDKSDEVLKSTENISAGNKENAAVMSELRKISKTMMDMSRRMDKLTETVVYMEKRLSLVEEQVKLVHNTNSA